MAQNITTNAYSLKIIFWNILSYNSRKHDIEKIIQKYDIFICVESWLIPEKKENIQLPGFVTYRKDRQSAKGGDILIFIRKKLAFIENTCIKSPNQAVEMCSLQLTNVTPSSI